MCQVVAFHIQVINKRCVSDSAVIMPPDYCTKRGMESRREGEEKRRGGEKERR